jgi:DNA-binding transcriptional LysR family regulator
MNLSQLRAFVAVVEHNSFSSAARALGVSQPAVTMQVQGLESDVGATLLDRYYRKVELTEAGRALLPFARDILSSLEDAQIAVDKLSGKVTGRLVLAASTTPGQYILPRLLGEFIREHPEVGVELVVHDTSEVVALVEAGDANLGMTGAQFPGTRVEFEELGADSLVMICPPDSDLASKRKLKLTDLVDEPFIMREQGSGTRIVMEETLKAGGIDPGELRVVTELGSSEAIVTAVEGGMGIGVVSRWMADKALELGTVAEVRAAHFPSERPFYLVLPKGTLTRAADAFVDFLREKL